MYPYKDPGVETASNTKRLKRQGIEKDVIERDKHTTLEILNRTRETNKIKSKEYHNPQYRCQPDTYKCQHSKEQCNWEYEMKKDPNETILIQKQIEKTKYRPRRGGMYTNNETDMQIELNNLNTNEAECDDCTKESSEEENNSNSKQKWRFLNTISPSISVDEDESGNLIFRRFNYGIMITTEEMTKCIRLVIQDKPIIEINELIDLQALYNSSVQEYESTEGQGLCAVLALVGTLNPQLNSKSTLRSSKGRNEIADVVEDILIPSMQEYDQPHDYHINPRAQEHEVHKEHTSEYLMEIASLLRSTTDNYVDIHQWMYASGVGTVVQSMPSEVLYWQGIGCGRWLALNLWSSTAGSMRRQTMETLQKILKPNTGHIAYLNSHFFNLKDIGANRYSNLLIEIVNAIVLMHEKDEYEKNTRTDKNEVIQAQELDEDSIATQKGGAQWFMSISKKRARELSRVLPSQIENELLQSKSTIQINRRTDNVNWTLISGDSYCGYQALHAVAMYADGVDFNEIKKNVQTKERPYKLIAFLQKQIGKLQGQNMTNALTRTNAAIQGLKRNQPLSKHFWCPTEMIAYLLPTIHLNSSYWNHSRPPVGLYEWITTYYNPTRLECEVALDIIYNGLDHYTVQLSSGVNPKDIKEAISNLANEIVNGSNSKDKWRTIRGQRITRMKRTPIVVDMVGDEEEYTEVVSKRTQKNQAIEKHEWSYGHEMTKHITNKIYNLNSDEALETPVNRNLREKTKQNYAPEYHPLDDAISPTVVLDIPFPKDQRRDETALKTLVYAPSRIGSGMGVYTIGNIPKNTIIMEYIDEVKEIIMKKDIIDGIRDTTYMYANHKTNTYINASNNTHSYCGLVNEALEDKNFNTIIIETRDKDGRARVYFKTTRNITAKEEIGTRYSIDGSYWDNSKTYTKEFLDRVSACYNKSIPFQRTESKMEEKHHTKEIYKNKLPCHGKLGQIMRKYDIDTTNMYSNKPIQKIDICISDSPDITAHNTCTYIYETPIKKCKIVNQTNQQQHRMTTEEDSQMEIDVSEEGGSDEGEYFDTIYQSSTNIETQRDDTCRFYPRYNYSVAMSECDNMEKDKDEASKSPGQHATCETIRKHKMIGTTLLKRKRTTQASDNRKHKRGEKRIPRRDKARKRINSVYMQMNIPELQQINKETLVEYNPDQKCRHKKAIDEEGTTESQDKETSPKEKKKKAMEAIKKLIQRPQCRVDTGQELIVTKIHNLRTRASTDYTVQLEYNKPNTTRTQKYKEPDKPKYTLGDPTVTNDGDFMIAQSNLKYETQGVFARNAIPLKGNRKLFEYRSENNYGATQSDRVDRYLAYKSDNKYMVHIGNVVVDATGNVDSYCNHVQELLCHSTPFNCKYVKSGNQINIVQIAPIAKNEELNIQYSVDGNYWKNRISGYPDEILKKARKYYKFSEPDKIVKIPGSDDMPSYQSVPKKAECKDSFHLMQQSTLFRWKSNCNECNLRIATLNINGALYDMNNGEPQFILQLMEQCSFNVLGLTDTRTPTDKVDKIIKSIKYTMPQGTAVICFPTKRLTKDSTRLTTMGGQMILIDKQWESHLTNKRSDDSGLSLIVSVCIAFQEQSITIIQVMVPPSSKGKHTMWSRIKTYLNEKGINKTPREYVMDTATKWYINALTKGYRVIIMGDFNRTSPQLEKWQNENNLQRAHAKIEIAQEHPARKLYTYLRNSTTYSHIDHIYHSTLDPLDITSVGATDHAHIHEKTDHFPIWIGINWKGYMEEKIPHIRSASIRNQPDLDLGDKDSIELFAKELDEYVGSIGLISPNITPTEAACMQAAIYAKSSEIAKGGNKIKFQTTRPRGTNHRFKDGFSPSFRILQESLHAYVNLGRAINRLTKRTHTAVSRLQEIHKIYPRWKKVYEKYANQVHQEDHPDTSLFPLELNNITLQNSKRIDIADRVAKIKARLHGRQRTILRAKLSDRCKEMQYNISINKLKKVIQMIIPTDRSPLDYAAIEMKDKKSMTDKLADLEANRVMKNWMEVPDSLHYISQEFESDTSKWKTLLAGQYKPPDSNIPYELMTTVAEAFKMKEITEQTKTDLSTAMHAEFTFTEFNSARKNVTKNKSPGPSGVTNNQMRSWNDTTAKAIYELSSIMWKHHAVPQFWQDRLMTLLPKVAGVNDLTKIRPISLFENIRKLWAGMVARRIQTIWNRDKLLHANQHGFRWQRGTHTAVIHLLNQLELADTLHPVFLTMWDIRRAFDSVPKWLQRLAWARLGLQTQDLEWFLKLDATGNIHIRTPEFESKKKMTKVSDHLLNELPMLDMKNSNCFHPERGVGQGDTPSSLIFIAVFDILLTLLDDSGTGQPHAYADDLAHIALTQEDQQRHADLVSAFCVITGLEVATAKVEAIALNHNPKNLNSTLIIRDWWWTPHLIIQSGSDFWTRYLGIYLDTNLCGKHYEQAVKQYRFSCNALIHRTAPSSAKKMVHTLCLRPKIRYIAALAPWTLKQYKDIDKVPYQLFCQIYGLRKGFPLALIYTPITLGGCGDTKLSDEANSMKWKILHSSIHLGGLSKDTSNALIERATTRRKENQKSRGYADSMIEWCMEMGLTLDKHVATDESFPLRRLNQLLTLQDPNTDIRIYTDGAYDAEKEVPLMDKLMYMPTQLRHRYGIGQSGVYIVGTQKNGVQNQIAMKLTFQEKTRFNTTPFLQELIGILVGINVSYNNPNSVIAYTDCKSAMAKVRDVIRPGSNSVIHLPYGPILSSIDHNRLHKYQINWVESHPERKKRGRIWDSNDLGIYKADMMASNPMHDLRKNLPQTTIITGDINEIVTAAIPTDTWIWKSNEGKPVFESLRTLSSQRAHITYLNRRDTLRNKGNLIKPSRWSRYNMHFATHLNGSRKKCSTRIRGHQCKQLYDWTTHAVNIAKGIADDNDRHQQSICKLCKMRCIENQVHTSTTCKNTELTYIRKIYQKEIENILIAFNHIKLPKKEKWIRSIMAYVAKHIWGDTEITADIWNGRWNQHMWEEALDGVEEKTRKNINPKLCKKWMRVVTSKLFETQSALSRHRFKLSKRLKDPMFERSPSIPQALKKRLFDQHEADNLEERIKKRRKGVQGTPDNEQWINHTWNTGNANSRKKRKNVNTTDIDPSENRATKLQRKSKQRSLRTQQYTKISTVTKRTYRIMKQPAKTHASESNRMYKKRKLNNHRQIYNKSIRNNVTPCKPRHQIYNINKTRQIGMPTRRGWHHYRRHTLQLRFRVKKKHKLDNTHFPHPKRTRR